MLTEFLIAWRYIKSKRKEHIISAIAMFSLVGLALGVATLIIVTSVMNGFKKEFTDRVIGFNGHIALYPLADCQDYKGVCADLLKIKGVRQAVPSVEKQTLITKTQAVRGSLCNGMTFEDLKAKELISKNITAGDIENFKDENAIVMGGGLASRLGALIGDEICVIAPEMESTGFGFIPRKKTFRLAAVFKSGMHEYDSSMSFISLGMAQILFRVPDSINAISVFVDDPLKLNEVKKRISKKYGYMFRITNWQDNNSSFMRAVEIERNVMFLILTLITLVASFNIISCMIMLVKDKEKDIAILRTMGMTQKSITRIFFFAGMWIGSVGTFIGAVLGLAFALNIKKIQAFIEQIFNCQVFSPEVYFLSHLPSVLRAEDVVVTVFVALLLSALATIYPARKAGKLNPTEILRYA